MKNSTRTPGIIEQIRIAFQNPMAVAIGLIFGGIVPVAVFQVAHNEINFEENLLTQINSWLVLGGLIFSAKTVWTWTARAFNDKWKATGMVVLLEGVMVQSQIEWLTVTILAILVFANFSATACTVALDDKGKGKKVSKKEKAVAKARRTRKARQAEATA